MESAATPPRLRVLISVVVTVLLCLLSTLRSLSDARRVPQNKTWNVARQSDERFADLRLALPKRGVVGYVGDSGEAGTSDYYLAQYALAPLVVERSIDPPIVIGNFPDQSRPPLVAGENLVLVRDFGNGVLLFSTKDKK